MYDLIVAGRYPDDQVLVNDKRTIDIYDANSGGLVHQLRDPNAAGIISVRMFFLLLLNIKKYIMLMIRIPKNVYTTTQMFGVSEIFFKDINTLIQ